jgi:hypothetical protein
MTTIHSLFDPAKSIDRTIEKVITYGAATEARLKTEISEYIVTASIEEAFYKLLDRMELAMDAGGENEVGVWVSGFYGSGKSSFTKYLGFALDPAITVDGVRFLKHLQDRLHKAQTRARLANVAQRFPAAVVMLDLASDMVAGSTMEDVSTVLYFKVLQWAGYSRNLKIAALERRLKKDGRYEEFTSKTEQALPGVTWQEMQNDPLVVDDLVPRIAHEMYPALFTTPGAFSSSTEGFFRFEEERVAEMIDIVRSHTGKEHIVFVLDEVGQYVAARDNLILNLDGLAKNLKRLGDGKVWIISTAQQTLTEDDPRAALNSAKLYKLKDRFPIQIDLQSSDIREICYRRLLGKSPAGEAELGALFDAQGQGLRYHIKLDDAKHYEADFNRQSFVNLYPFLPAHFDILLHLLGALAKSTGGLGLRSAIKIVQDVLRGEGGRPGLARQPVGALVTTATLYDELENEIRRSFDAIHLAVQKVRERYASEPLHLEVAKTVAVLQILSNLPVTVRNIAALMHPAIDHTPLHDRVSQAVDDMLQNPYVPLGEREGQIVFLSDRMLGIEQERSQLALRRLDVQRHFNEALREVFNPLPKVQHEGTLTVTSGLKVRSAGVVASQAGEQHTVQTVVEFVPLADFDKTRDVLVEDSRDRANQTTIALLARSESALEDLAQEIYRCHRIAEAHRLDSAQEVKDYCNAQLDRAAELSRRLQAGIKLALQGGAFIFRGQVTAASALEPELLDAARKLLGDVAAQVYERYRQAGQRVETDTAERFLRAANPAAIGSQIDKLGFVQVLGGRHSFKTDHPAMVSVRDHIDTHGNVDGARLSAHFAAPPFGWSPDTLRYIVAAMLCAGELKLKVSGREVTTAGQLAIDALKTNNTFRNVSVGLRQGRPAKEALARAAQRLSVLVGETVIPLEQDISQAAARHFPRFQQDYAPLAARLDALGLPGADRVRSLNQAVADLLFNDASDATAQLGAEASSLYDDLTWAQALKTALDQGLEKTLAALGEHRRELQQLPDTGVPGALRHELAAELQQLAERLAQPDFHRHGTEYAATLTHVQARVREAALQQAAQHQQRIKDGVADLQRMPCWAEMTAEQRSFMVARVEDMTLTPSEDLAGLRRLLARQFDLASVVDQLKHNLQQEAEQRARQRVEGSRRGGGTTGETREGGTTTLRQRHALPAVVRSVGELDAVITGLQAVKQQAAGHAEVEIAFDLAAHPAAHPAAR